MVKGGEARTRVFAALVLASTSLILVTLVLYSSLPNSGEFRGTEIVILVDNNPSPSSGLESAWGLSILVKVNGTTVLFDTGPDPEVLRRNSEALGVDLSSIDYVFLSHEHIDHTGGVPYVISRKPGVRIYVPRGFSEGLIRRMTELGAHVMVVENATELGDGVMTTGPMRGPPSEQGLLVKSPRGWILLTGCAHPGIEKMMRRAKNLTGNLYAVIGGFHLVGADASRLERLKKTIEELGVREVYPIHCSGDGTRSFLRERIPDVYRGGHVGSVIRWGSGDNEAAGGSG